MNTTLLYRLIWKEIRAQRGLWLSVMGLGIGLQIACLQLGDIQKQSFAIRQALFGLALFAPAVVGLASVVMSFAGEREEGTDQFLSRMGVPPISLLFVKAAINLAGVVALFGVLFASALLDTSMFLRQDGYFETTIAPLMQMMALSWTVGLFCWGLFCSLIFRRVLPCLITALVATTLTMSFVDVDVRVNGYAGLRLLGGVSSVLLLLSVGLVSRWDENRWPRPVEWLIRGIQRLGRLRLRVTSTDGRMVEAVSVIPSALRRELEIPLGIRQAFLRWFGFSQPDEWMSSWRRETRRLLWLELWSAVWVCLGLVVAASVVWLALLKTAGSAADIRFVMSTLPVMLAFVAFSLGVWSFQGQQREQRFRFFAAHGASPHAMWLVKHVVWLSVAVLAVLSLLAFSVIVSDGLVGRAELIASSFRNLLIGADPNNPQVWSKLDRPGGLIRLIYAATYCTATRPTEFIEPGELTGEWPLVSLLWLALRRGVLGTWLCFAIGQFSAMVIPRAVTALLAGVIPLGLAIGWWLVNSICEVPLLIAVCPVLLGLLAAAWGRMNDRLEERSDWRRWVRVALTALVPMFVAFVGMATYRVCEVPVVDAPFERTVPMAEARQTGEAWIRLAEQLESPFAENSNAPNQPLWFTSIGSLTVMQWQDVDIRAWLTANTDALNEAMLLSQRSTGVLPRTWGPWDHRYHDPLARVVLLLKMSAFESLANHRLDEAWQRALALYRLGQQIAGYGNGLNRWAYAVQVQEAAMHVLREWAMSADQTEKSLLAALGHSDVGRLHPVAQLVRGAGSFVVQPMTLLQADYSLAWEGHTEGWEKGFDPPLLQKMFWERARAERVLNVQAQEGLHHLRSGFVGTAGHSWGRQQQLLLDAPYGRLLRDTDNEDSWSSFSERPSRGERWGEYSLLQVGLPQLGWTERLLSEKFFPSLGSLETHRRALWLTIALQAYRVKHGRLPDRLEDLVGRYLDRLPSDPFHGLPFEYRREGYPFALHLGFRDTAANTPLLISIGEHSRRREPVTINYWNEFRRLRPEGWENLELPNHLTWVAVSANRRWFQDILEPPYSNRFGVAFSLKPSF